MAKVTMHVSLCKGRARAVKEAGIPLPALFGGSRRPSFALSANQLQLKCSHVSRPGRFAATLELASIQRHICRSGFVETDLLCAADFIGTRPFRKMAVLALWCGPQPVQFGKLRLRSTRCRSREWHGRCIGNPSILASKAIARNGRFVVRTTSRTRSSQQS